MKTARTNNRNVLSLINRLPSIARYGFRNMLLGSCWLSIIGYHPEEINKKKLVEDHWPASGVGILSSGNDSSCSPEIFRNESSMLETLKLELLADGTGVIEFKVLGVGVVAGIDGAEVGV